jgi:hypothetical protein
MNAEYIAIYRVRTGQILEAWAGWDNLADSMPVLSSEPLYNGSLDGAETRELLNHNGFAVVSHVAEQLPAS